MGFEVFTAVVMKSISFWDTRRHIPEDNKNCKPLLHRIRGCLSLKTRGPELPVRDGLALNKLLNERGGYF
jgi:hypothetical protein